MNNADPRGTCEDEEQISGVRNDSLDDEEILNASEEIFATETGRGTATQLEFDFVNGNLSGTLSRTMTRNGWTGTIGQSNLYQALGGKEQAYFDTPYGARFTDVFANGVANESKVGYQALTESNMIQIVKDSWLVQNDPRVDAVIWNFYPSPITGKSGPSGPMADLLDAY